MQPRQQRALDLVLAGHSSAEVAKQVGVRRETVWRWKQDPAFAVELHGLQAVRRVAVQDELEGAALEAVQVLRGLMADEGVNPGVRVRAATALLDRAGATPAYGVESRHKAAQEAARRRTEGAGDPAAMARQVLASLDDVVAVLGADEVLPRLEGVVARGRSG